MERKQSEKIQKLKEEMKKMEQCNVKDKAMEVVVREEEKRRRQKIGKSAEKRKQMRLLKKAVMVNGIQQRVDAWKSFQRKKDKWQKKN